MSWPNRLSPYLAYHEITGTAPKYLYAVSAAQFREHAKWLRQMTSETKRLSENCFITFDDGHMSQFSRAFPILQEYSLKAIFFVTAGWTGQRSDFMSWAQLQELLRYGHEVQSHGWSHALLTNCSLSELRQELARSKCELENHLGVPIDAISMPGGRWSKNVLDVCKEIGYRRVFTSDPLMCPGERSGLRVAGRWMATRKLSAEKIPSLLEGRGAAVYLLRATHIAKTIAKRLLGDRAYQSMWHILAHKQERLET